MNYVAPAPAREWGVIGRKVDGISGSAKGTAANPALRTGNPSFRLVAIASLICFIDRNMPTKRFQLDSTTESSAWHTAKPTAGSTADSTSNHTAQSDLGGLRHLRTVRHPGSSLPLGRLRPHGSLNIKGVLVGLILLAGLIPGFSSIRAADGSKYAHSDSNARFLHQIHLYDANNRRISPDSTTPYSTSNTCGRCHDYDTISHGWHFNAFLADTVDGRQGEPWIWTDPRTGTQLPLSYRNWSQTFDPRTVGIDQWAMVKQFGGRIPGGGLGHAPDPDADTETSDETDKDTDDADRNAEQPDDVAQSNSDPSRWPLTGSLEIDCLACHGVSGSFDFNARREQIAGENFAWAATAGLKIATIKGEVSRIKSGSDPEDEATKSKLPQVTYHASRFADDGTVFVNLIRQPENNACYQCHSQRTVDDAGIQARWTHDEDVHLRAGMQCIDCHRNGIDHHIVRAFPGEISPTEKHGEHPDTGQAMVTLSCAGCHLGESFVNEISVGHADDRAAEGAGNDSEDGHREPTITMAGRLGSPQPAHAGLPPLHFEKLSCTACHGGPLPRKQALGIMTSLAHSLGEKGHRTGQELPHLAGPVYAKGEDGRVYPHRVMWPAYWASLVDGRAEPLAPDAVYDATRKALRVRKDFSAELLAPKLGSKELKEILGDDRYRTRPEEWTEEETAKVEDATRKAGEALFAEKVFAALQAIEEELGVEEAIYLSSGFVYGKGKEAGSLTQVELESDAGTEMIRWPMAHNVRPAGWSLGITGCVECHNDEGLLFASTVSAVGPGPDQGVPVSMASLQGIDADQRLTWNQLFSNRASFKYVIATSVIVLTLALLLGFGMLLGRLGRTA